MPEQNIPVAGEIVTRNGDTLSRSVEQLNAVAYGQRVRNGERLARKYEQAGRVVEARRRGLSFSQIARQEGISSGEAYKRFCWGISRTIRPEEATVAKLLDLDRLDHCLAQLYPMTLGVRQVTRTVDGAESVATETVDPEVQLAAIKTLVEVIKQRGKLFQYDDVPGPEDESAVDVRTKAALLPVLKDMTDEDLAALREVYERVARRKAQPKLESKPADGPPGNVSIPENIP